MDDGGFARPQKPLARDSGGNILARSGDRLAIIVPCYNEEAVLDDTVQRLLSLLSRLREKEKIAAGSRLYLIDDGSKDRTWPIIERWSAEDGRVVGIKLSRNCGHQNALLAGLFTADEDALVSIDADLQDDVAVIERMIDDYHRGIDVVYGVRQRRDTDTWFKRFTAESFYRLLSVLGVQVVQNHGDFRLMSRRAVDALKGFREVNLFLRGMVPLVGLPSSMLYYDRSDRSAGESKYSLSKMLALALGAVTAFSVAPLRIITGLGVFVFVGSMLLSLWVLAVRVFTDQAVPGWASTVLPIYLIGGVQILCLGIIGEYLGRIYSEVKARPRYIIQDVAAARPALGQPTQSHCNGTSAVHQSV
jgi:glycosyltransferase involved in cell wall biosynthesis